MSDKQDQIISECFATGRVGLDCDECGAHPVNGGECCFGTGHEYNHADCNRCEYESDCTPITHGTTRKKRKKRRIVRRTSRVLRDDEDLDEEESERLIQLPNRTSRRRRSLIDRTSEDEAQEDQEDQEEVFMQRLAKVTGWGMIEGGLQMALSFFQKNRPE